MTAPRPLTTASGWQPVEGREVLGIAAPGWAAGKTWLNSKPLTLASLRGKVVLIRFWLANCPYCRSSAPSLETFHRKYAERGLVVIGFHHPKRGEQREVVFVRRWAQTYGITFPVALDNDWEALNKYWFPNGEQRRFTSVSFLIDRHGIIRWLHDGGEFHTGGGKSHNACQQAYRSLEQHIQQLLG